MTRIYIKLHKYKLVIDNVFIKEITGVFFCLKIRKEIAKSSKISTLN